MSSFLAVAIFLSVALAQDSCVAPDGFDLSPLSSPKVDYQTRSADGTYTYTFNICTGIQTPCDFYPATALCQSFGLNVQVLCGKAPDQTISYQAGTNAYQFHYDGGDNGRTTDILVACDPTQTGSNFRWNVTNPAGSMRYLVTGYSAFACNPAHNPSPSPIPGPTGNFTFHVREDARGAQSWFLANNANIVLEQYGAAGPYTFPAIAKLINQFVTLINSGAYNWFAEADGTLFFVPNSSAASANSGQGGASGGSGNGSIAVSAYPVPAGAFKTYAKMIAVGSVIAAGNSIVVDAPKKQ